MFNTILVLALGGIMGLGLAQYEVSIFMPFLHVGPLVASRVTDAHPQQALGPTMVYWSPVF